MRTWVSENELKDMLGMDAAVALIKSCGGQRVYIPSSPETGHKLAKLLGIRGMIILCSAYPSQYIELPSPRDRATAKRQIVALLEKGKLTKPEIAAKVRVGVRYVELVASEHEQEKTKPHQHTLF